MMLSEELRTWIEREHSNGVDRSRLERSLVDLGWHAGSARETVDNALGSATRSSCPPIREPAIPALDLSRQVRSLCVHGRNVEIRAFVRHPTIILLDDFLSGEECDALVAQVAARVRPSRIADVERAQNDGLATYRRTSESVMLDSEIPDLVHEIEQRASLLLDWPIDRFEYMQVARYRPGEEFAPHHDYFDESFPGSASLIKDGGHRVATLLLYLSDVEAGGSTLFTDLQLEIVPRKGSALFFSYSVPHPLSLTEHGGAPVLRGEKWLSTIFIRRDRHRD